MVDFSDEMFNLSPEKDIDEEVEKIFKFYRKQGFPHYNKDDYDMVNEITKLIEFDIEKIFDSSTKTITQNMLGLGILWTYFPHWIEVKCGSATKSLKELWEDDDLVRKVIKKTYVWKLKHNEPHWTNNRIRQNVKVFLNGQTVSNFRPTVSRFIYEKFGNKGSVLDMSSGFGGRLFGFFASNCKKYIGIEPSTKTYNGLIELGNDLLKYRDKEFEIHKTGSEIFNMDWVDKFDLCFTSPPYFNTERYSDEPTQSWKKFDTLDLWLDGFLKNTIENCFAYTKKDGYMIINIMQMIKNVDVGQKVIEYANNIGFRYIDTWYMDLSSVARDKGRKQEPVFIFKR